MHVTEILIKPRQSKNTINENQGAYLSLSEKESSPMSEKDKSDFNCLLDAPCDILERIFKTNVAGMSYLGILNCVCVGFRECVTVCCRDEKWVLPHDLNEIRENTFLHLISRKKITNIGVLLHGATLYPTDAIRELVCYQLSDSILAEITHKRPKILLGLLANNSLETLVQLLQGKVSERMQVPVCVLLYNVCVKSAFAKNKIRQMGATPLVFITCVQLYMIHYRQPILLSLLRLLCKSRQQYLNYVSHVETVSTSRSLRF